MKVQKGSRGISLLFFNLRCGCGGWSRPPTGRFSTGQTWYPLYKELDGLQGRSGRAQENSPPPGFDSRTFRSVAAGYTNYVILVHPNFHTHIYIYTGCPRRNVKYFGRVFLMLNYTDIIQNTYIQS